MKFKRRDPATKKARRASVGFPVATIAWYGPDDKRATKVAVGVVHSENEGVAAMKRWYGEAGDLRLDLTVAEEIKEFLTLHGVKSVTMTNGILGCPHEEGVDYPDGQVCPECPFWEGRDRYF